MTANGILSHQNRWMRAAVAALLFAALIQWAILADRLIAALWQGYKFYGYGGGGHITVSATAQLLFYCLSLPLTVAAFLLARSSRDQPRIAALARFCALSLLAGTVIWTAVLLTPLVAFRR